MKKYIFLAFLGLAIAGVLASSPSGAAVLESPAHQAVVSGIGFIGGWKCDANNITVTIDGGAHISVAMGQPRGDTQPLCDTINNGFIQQINWAHVGDGEHEAGAYDNGVEFSRSTFTVGSTGEEFLQGVRRRQLLENFPALKETTEVQWNESTQHFEIRGGLVGLGRGGVPRIVDADTLELDRQKVRLQGIDAPESAQTCRDASGQRYQCGKQATQALQTRLGQGAVRCTIESRDRYGRDLGTCYTSDGVNVNAWLVQQGHALAYRRYSTEYVPEEDQARGAAAGLWAGEFIKPWDWRRGVRLD